MSAREIIMEGNEGYKFRDVIDNLTEDQILGCMEEYAKQQQGYSGEEMLEAFIEGYKQRAEKSDLIFDNASRMYAIHLFKQFKNKQETLEEDLDEIKNIRLWLKDRKQRFIKQFKNK